MSRNEAHHGVISQNITRSEPTSQPSDEELGHVADGPINQTKSTSASEHAMLESEGEKRSDRVPQVQAAGSMQPNEPLHKDFNSPYHSSNALRVPSFAIIRPPTAAFSDMLMKERVATEFRIVICIPNHDLLLKI